MRVLSANNHGRVTDGGQARGDYGTIVSSGSSSDNLHEYQIIGKDSEHVRVEVTEIIEQKYPRPPIHPNFWLIFCCICWNEFVSGAKLGTRKLTADSCADEADGHLQMANFDSTLMASSHPVITSEFQASNSASWLSTSFLITATAFMPIFAPLSDTVGRKPIMLVTSAILATAIAWCATAPNIGSFIAARTLCGLGAGGTAAMGAVMINDFVPIEVRATYQSFLALAYGLGQASGVALGGFFCDTIGWRLAFGIQVPGIIACGVGFAIAIPNDLGPQLARNSKGAMRKFFQSFDISGVVLLAISVTCLILYLNLGGNVLRWSDPSMTTFLVVSLLTAFFFIRAEAKAKHPVLPLELITSSPRAYINFLAFSGGLIFSAVIFNIPLYFEVVKHDSPTVAGFRLLIPVLALTASSFLSCMIIKRKQAIIPTATFGALMTLVGAGCLPLLGPAKSSWASLLLLLPLTMGTGFLTPTSAILLLRTSPPKEHAVSISGLLLWRRLANVIGVALSTLSLQNLLSYFLHKTVTGSHREEVCIRTWCLNASFHPTGLISGTLNCFRSSI